MHGLRELDAKARGEIAGVSSRRGKTGRGTRERYARRSA